MSKPRCLLARLVGAAALLVLAGCGALPPIHAKGEFHGEMIDTTVDSRMARYYLQDYLQGTNRSDPRREEIDQVYRDHPDATPSREELKTISDDFSVDFASLFLADHLLLDGCNRALNQAFNAQVDEAAPAPPNGAGYFLLFVPGWNYIENGQVNGADFARPRELATSFGFENALAPLQPTGSVEENAQILAGEIRKRSRSTKKLVLVGASSAGPTIHLVLGEKLKGADSGKVAAWLNLGGILQGSPAIDYFQIRPQRWAFSLAAWYWGWDKNAVLSMDTANSRARFQRLHIAPKMLIINYIGIPLSGQLTKYSRDLYALSRSQGPNDGLTLLADAIAPDSRTIVAMGSDHFLTLDPQIDRKATALMKLTVDYLQGRAPRACQ